jgi:N-acetylglucosamine kinase-like BadF-type ATPase
LPCSLLVGVAAEERRSSSDRELVHATSQRDEARDRAAALEQRLKDATTRCDDAAKALAEEAALRQSSIAQLLEVVYPCSLRCSPLLSCNRGLYDSQESKAWRGTSATLAASLEDVKRESSALATAHECMLAKVASVEGLLATACGDDGLRGLGVASVRAVSW